MDEDADVMDEEVGHNIYNRSRVHVCETMCSTCIFRPGNLMHLTPGTVKSMTDTTEKDGDGAVIVCHQTLGTDQNAVCRGWLDSKVGQQDKLMRLAYALDLVEEINP